MDALELDDQYCHPGPSLVPPFKRVVITEGSYRTYSAALVWLQTGHIEFAPLSSRSDTDVDNGAYDDESESSNAGALCASADPQPRLVLARASPKSVYRLADLLSLDTLKSLAFANFVSQLTAASAAFELYSEAATTYPELRDVVLAFVVRHWDEAKSSDAMQEMERRAGLGQLPVGAAKTAMLLAKALAEELAAKEQLRSLVARLRMTVGLLALFLQSVCDLEESAARLARACEGSSRGAQAPRGAV